MRCPTVVLLASGLMACDLAQAAVPDGELRTDHLKSRLVAQTDAAVAGSTLRIGLLLRHDPHWHTYWRNPGDSGLPTRIELQLPPGVTAGPIAWPAPQRFDVEGIVNFGYADEILLPIDLQLPPTLDDDALQISASASWLICEIECIPGRGDYQLQLPLRAKAALDARWSAAFATAAQRQPRALAADARASYADAHVQVDIRGAGLPADIAAWEIFPVQQQVLVNGAYPMLMTIDQGMRMRFPASESFVRLPPQLDLILVKEDQALLLRAQTSAFTPAQ